MGDQQRADQKGALQAIASKPGGSVVLWLMVLGFLAYAAWRFSEAAFGRRDETDEKKRTAKRLGSAANGAIYLSFAVLAFRTVTSGPLAAAVRTSPRRCWAGRVARRSS